MLHHQGTVEHKPLTPLPSTGLKLTDCVWHCLRQWGKMVMARSSGTNNKKRVDKQSNKGCGTKYWLVWFLRYKDVHALQHVRRIMWDFMKGKLTLSVCLFWTIFDIFTFLGENAKLPGGHFHINLCGTCRLPGYRFSA